ncbi:metalloregulator ArsR/SmtB family transcription factor [Salinisphaera sp.]|uniref:metalloregulator ArsR/SmtB family transcription factor n=1 Tax=Salinisphaera sp. TaxID=1914330 RepID=UPI000C493A44|nr:metalloregulator ArsR/SmtB family transcription factor [Salinisphaera sp.]MBS62202.1 transcriptional regulator [Salinisphaera sp.]
MTVQPEHLAAEPAAHEVFQALADDTRLRCLLLIAAHGELCVCELVHALDLSQPKISRHLKLLRDAGVVDDRRERIWVYYRIREQLPAWVGDIINTAWRANAEREPFISDTQRLATMADRPGARCAG